MNRYKKAKIKREVFISMLVFLEVVYFLSTGMGIFLFLLTKSPIVFILTLIDFIVAFMFSYFAGKEIQKNAIINYKWSLE